MQRAMKTHEDHIAAHCLINGPGMPGWDLLVWSLDVIIWDFASVLRQPRFPRQFRQFAAMEQTMAR